MQVRQKIIKETFRVSKTRKVFFLLLLIAGLISCQESEPSAPTPTTVAVAPTIPPTATVIPPTLTPIPPSPTPIPSPTLTLFAGDDTIGDPFTPELGNTGYDVQSYNLQLAINPTTATVDGVVTIQAVTTIDSLRQISLDFVGFDVRSVTVNELLTNFSRQDGKLYIDFPQPFMTTDAPLSIAVSYIGQPIETPSPYIRFDDHLGLTFLPNSTFYVLAQPDGARYWFPNNDHPLDKAIFRFELTVPLGLAAIANGQLVESAVTTMPDGTEGVTFVWEHNAPMATYLALAAAGHYLRVDEVSPGGIPLTFYYFPEMEEEFFEAVDITGEAIDWMVELYGPYPFEQYGQATYYAMGISMEAQTMSLISYQMLNEETVIHELAHVWFGNWVTPASWADMWRNEGFATYTELLWISRNDPSLLDAGIAEIEAEVAERGQIYPLDEPPLERLFAFETYNRGALLVHALRLEMGDEAFFSGVRRYLELYGGGTATHDQFETVMEEAVGRSLDEFFAGWLE